MHRMFHTLSSTDKSSSNSNMCVSLLNTSLDDLLSQIGQISKTLLSTRQVFMEHFSVLFVMLVMHLVCILSTAVIIFWLLRLVFISGEQASCRQLRYKSYMPCSIRNKYYWDLVWNSFIKVMPEFYRAEFVALCFHLHVMLQMERIIYVEKSVYSSAIR